MMWQRVKEAFFETMKVWASELRLIFKDAGVLLFVIALPLGYPILYTLCYNPELVRDVPITVIDQSHTSLSREYIRELDATPNVKVIGLSENANDALESIQRQDSYGYIVIPSDFASNINSMKQSTVSVYCDMSGMLYYQSIVTGNTGVSLALNDRIRTQYAGNTTDRQDELTNAPITYEEVNLYNTSAGMASYIIPAVLMLILQQTILLGMGMTCGTAWEEKRFYKLLVADNKTKDTLHIILGVALCYIGIEIFNTCYLTGVVPYMFNLNQLMHTDTMIAFMIPYVLACIFFAMTLGTLIRNRETTMLVFVFTSVPLLFISGISWPGASVPAFWKGVSYLFPSTFGINGYVRINADYATLKDVKFEYIMLWVQTLVYFLTAYLSSLYIRRKVSRQNS